MRKFLAVLPLILLYGCDDQPRKVAVNELRFEHSVAVDIEAETAADAVFCENVAATNKTAEFRERFHHFDQFAADPHLENLKKYNILLVHGLMGEVGLKVQSMLDWFDNDERILDYLKDQRKAAADLGLQCELPGFKSASTDRSSNKIVDAILKSEKPVIIISHSKGGVDSLDALLKLSQQGKLDRVAGWISIQGVFYGSPDADDVIHNKFKKAYAFVAIKTLGGDFDSVRDLTTRKRERYQEEHRAEIETVVQKVPTLCFASWDSTPKSKKNDEPGPLCDGQVPTRSAILPGCEYIAKSNVSHSMPVIHSSKPFDRVTFTKALLLMLAEQMKN